MRNPETRLVLVIDGQGGGIGSQLVKLLRPRRPGYGAVGGGATTVRATTPLHPGGGARGATGENAIRYNASLADLIAGPIGVILANGIMGEVSPEMASAISGARAHKVLIPSATCGVHIAGAEGLRLEEYLRRAADDAVQLLTGGAPA